MRRTDIDRAHAAGTPVAYQDRNGGGYDRKRYRIVDPETGNGFEFGETEIRRIRGSIILRVEIVAPGTTITYQNERVESSRRTIVRLLEPWPQRYGLADLPAGREFAVDNAKIIGIWGDLSWMRAEQDRRKQIANLAATRNVLRRELIATIAENLVVSAASNLDVDVAVSLRAVPAGRLYQYPLDDRALDVVYPLVVSLLAVAEELPGVRGYPARRKAIVDLDSEIAALEAAAPVEVDDSQSVLDDAG